MTFRHSLIGLGLAGWLTASTYAADGIEVLARGPVHEAYAEPSEREPKPSPVIPKEPPKAIEELPPDQKPQGDNVQWMPGYWSWDDEKKDFVWVSGFWRNAPAGRAWAPGSWAKTDDGWQWTGGFWAAANPDQPEKANVDYLPQPPAPLDADGPTVPRPSETDVYVPGSWIYRDRYVWQPGYWAEYQPDRVWVASSYRWTPAGYVFVDGYWDYPLADRGTLFAPAYIPPAVYADPAFVYTPNYVVQENCLYGSLFCRRGFGSYYFGDYFSPAYANLGFTAWCGNVGISLGFGGNHWYDPLFGYYRCGFRSDPFWGGGGIFDLYAGRYRGDYLRPPTTLVQQNTVINNITRNRTVNNITNVNNVTMLSSLNQVNRSGHKRLESVSDPDRRRFAQTAHESRQAAERRSATEGQLRTHAGTGARAGQPRSAALPVIPNRAATQSAGTAGNRNGPSGTARPRPASIGRTPLPRQSAAPGARANPQGSARERPSVGGRPAINPGTGLPPQTGRATLPPRTSPRTNPIAPQSRPSTSPRALPRTNPALPQNRPLTAPRAAPRASTPPTRTQRPSTVRPPSVRSPSVAPRTRSVPMAPRNVARPTISRPAVARPAPSPRMGPAARPAQHHPVAPSVRSAPTKRPKK